MRIEQICQDKKRYLELLLLADEQEDMIDRYLEKGDMYVLFSEDEPDTVVAECVVCDNGNGVYEIKNLAVLPKMQGKGYGRYLIDFVCGHYRDCAIEIWVGTGDSPLTIPFYRKCGFVEHHRVKGFFTENYDHPIIEAGVQLVDMVYLAKRCEFCR